MVGSIRVTYRSKIAKIVPVGYPRWPPWQPSWKSIFCFSWTELTPNFLGQVRKWVTWGQKLGHLAKSAKSIVITLVVIISSNHHESCSKCLSWWFLGQVQNWVTWGQKLGHLAKSTKTLLTLLRSHFWSSHHESCLKCFVLMSSRSSLKLGHLESKTRSPGQISRKLC